MKKQDNKIKCPKCGTEIDVNEILYHQLEDDFKKQYSLRLDEEKKKIEKQLKEKIKEEQNIQIKTLEEELNEKSDQLKDYNKAKADIARLTREKNELKANLEAEAEKKLEGLKGQLNAQLAEEKKKFSKQYSELEKEKENIEKEKQSIEEQIKKGVQEKLKAETQKIEKQLKEQIREEQGDQFNELQKELNEKSAQLKEFNKAKAEIERLKREKNELKETVEAEAEKKFNELLNKEREKIKKFQEDKNQLKLSEKEHVIEQLKKQLQEAQRKAEQGSMQLQGEVQELAIEEWLASNFPLDTIEEIKKGARGGDCLQIVNSRTRQNCGSIYYESKRTKDFQPAWIEKFKTDIREKGANIGVLVTDAMPKDMERMGLKEGIWVCTFEEFRGLCFVLRESVIQISHAIASQENKGDKMNMLYAYLTSNEFKLQVEAIVEGFTQMQEDLEREKRAMQGIWKKREKQIEKVILNTTHMYSSIKGIAGSAIQTVKKLEMPEVEKINSFNSSIGQLQQIPERKTKKIQPSISPQSETISILPSFQGHIPTALQHALEVICLIKNGYTRYHATQFVAQQHNVSPSTIQDQYCRKLNLKASDFDRFIDEPDLISLRRILTQKYSQHNNIINEIIMRRNNF